MTSIVWNDEYNEDYTGEVTVSPSSGNGNAQVSISGSPNEGLDNLLNSPEWSPENKSEQ